MCLIKEFKKEKPFPSFAHATTHIVAPNQMGYALIPMNGEHDSLHITNVSAITRDRYLELMDVTEKFHETFPTATDLERFVKRFDDGIPEGNIYNLYLVAPICVYQIQVNMNRSPFFVKINSISKEEIA